MTEVVTQKMTKPRDCVLAFGIPTTREEFFHALREPQGRDFAPNCWQSWQDYHYQVASFMERLLPPLEALGLTIVRGLTLQDCGKLLRCTQYSVIILFSHWRDDAIEFADGLAPAQAVIREVPDSFQGIIDLCVCHPDSLAIELGERWPHSVVKFTDVETTPVFWLYIYLAVMNILSKENTTYLDALERVINAFLAKGKTER